MTTSNYESRKAATGQKVASAPPYCGEKHGMADLAAPPTVSVPAAKCPFCGEVREAFEALDVDGELVPI